MVGCIKKRFEQNDYISYYSKLENLLLDAVRGKLKLQLETQLCSLPDLFKADEDNDIPAIINKFQKMSKAMRMYFSEVVILIKLLLSAPATNAVSERSCSTLRRIKSYLRTTMSQSRTNHTILLNTYKEELDRLNMEEVAEEFCKNFDERQNLFGKFSKRDFPAVYSKRISLATQTC